MTMPDITLGRTGLRVSRIDTIMQAAVTAAGQTPDSV